MQQEESWEQISEEKGWSLEDCLNFKLLFKKGKGAGTDKAKMTALSAHIKSLRAAGWHLFSLADQYAPCQQKLCIPEEAPSAHPQPHGMDCLALL